MTVSPDFNREELKLILWALRLANWYGEKQLRSSSSIDQTKSWAWFPERDIADLIPKILAMDASDTNRQDNKS